MNGKELRALRVLYVTRTPNKTNHLIEYLKNIGVSVDVEDNLSEVNGVKASKIRGKTYKYIIVDEVISEKF